jgi:hypothetical protein
MPSWHGAQLSTGTILPLPVFIYTVHISVVEAGRPGVTPIGGEGGAKDVLFSISIQTGPGAHPASYTMGTGSPSWG